MMTEFVIIVFSSNYEGSKTGSEGSRTGSINATNSENRKVRGKNMVSVKLVSNTGLTYNVEDADVETRMKPGS